MVHPCELCFVVAIPQKVRKGESGQAHAPARPDFSQEEMGYAVFPTRNALHREKLKGLGLISCQGPCFG